MVLILGPRAAAFHASSQAQQEDSRSRSSHSLISGPNPESTLYFCSCPTGGESEWSYLGARKMGDVVDSKVAISSAKA